jgi:hypothetical protein
VVGAALGSIIPTIITAHIRNIIRNPLTPHGRIPMAASAPISPIPSISAASTTR